MEAICSSETSVDFQRTTSQKIVPFRTLWFWRKEKELMEGSRPAIIDVFIEPEAQETLRGSM
jgi:hypothetical protein